jgi:hypothetical protein
LKSLKLSNDLSASIKSDFNYSEFSSFSGSLIHLQINFLAGESAKPDFSARLFAQRCGLGELFAQF